MTNRELVMQRLVDTFQDAESFAIIESLVEGTSGVSLRLLDFFLCHYSLRHNVQYSLPGEPLPFHVRQEYSQYLDNVRSVVGTSYLARSFTDASVVRTQVRQGAVRLLQPETAHGPEEGGQDGADERWPGKRVLCLLLETTQIDSPHSVSLHRSARWWRGR